MKAATLHGETNGPWNWIQVGRESKRMLEFSFATRHDGTNIGYCTNSHRPFCKTIFHIEILVDSFLANMMQPQLPYQNHVWLFSVAQLFQTNAFTRLCSLCFWWPASYFSCKRALKRFSSLIFRCGFLSWKFLGHWQSPLFLTFVVSNSVWSHLGWR